MHTSRCIHFFFKFRPAAHSNLTHIPSQVSESFFKDELVCILILMITQFIASSMEGNLTLSSEGSRERLWTHYQRMAVRLRRGACTVESTFFSPDTSMLSQPLPVAPTSSDSNKSNNRRYNNNNSGSSNSNSNSEIDRKMLAERATRPVFGGIARMPMFPGTSRSLACSMFCCHHLSSLLCF